MTNDTFNAAAYFNEIANNLKAIRESATGNHFTKVSGLRAMEGFLAEFHNLQGYQLVYMDHATGKLIDHKSDNILDNRFLTFFVLYPAPNSLHSSKGEEAVQGCLNIAKKIIGKMREDRRNYINKMERIDISSINYEQIGPVGSGWYGVSVNFFMYDNPGNIYYNAGDWYS